MRRRSLTALACAMMLSACTIPTITVAPQATTSTAPTGPGATPWAVLSSGPTSGGAPRAAVQTGVTVSGAVKVPAGIVAAGGMNLVAAGSGNLVAAGSGNIVAAGSLNYGLLAVEEEAAAGADVFLADAAGNPIPGLEKVKTDAQGNFSIPNVPPDFTFVVAAEVQTKDGKKATFQTLAKPGKLGATAVVDAATTLVASNVLEGQKGADLGDFNPAVFKTAAETTAKNLDKDKLPDFSDRASVKAKMAQLMEAVAELKQSVDQLRTEISEVKKTLEDLRAALEKANEQPAPGEQPPTTDVRPQPSYSPPPGESPLPMRSGEPYPPPTNQPAYSPPPGGTGGKCEPGNHQFILPDKPESANIETIEFKIPTPDKPRDQWMNASTAKREFGFWANTPQGCPHLVLFKDRAGTVIHSLPDFMIPVGAPKQVNFYPSTGGTYTSPKPSPYPSTTYSQPPTTTQPSAGTQPPPGGCTERRFHRLRVTKAGAHLLFDVPNTTDHQTVAEARLAADGTWEVDVPEGCAHDVKLFDADWQMIGDIRGFVIPTGSQTDLTLAL